MKNGKVLGTLGLLVAAGMVSPAATASEAGWYLGGNLGQSRATIDDKRIVAGLLSDGFTTTTIRDDNRDLGFKGFGGYQFSRNWALEGGYFDLGQFGFDATTQPQGTVSGQIKVQGVNLDVVGSLPITQRLSAFARGGATYIEAKDRFSGTGSANVLDPRRSKRGANYKFGLGLEYAVLPSLGLRLEAERYRVDDAVGNNGDIDLFSLGLVYRFGQQPAAVQSLAVAAPEQPYLPVTPPPVVAALPVVATPPPRKISLSADSLFAFDQSVISSRGKQSLDELATGLKGSSFEVITVTGHTDRIGSESYNDALSLRRADAVKSYLVETSDIPANKIEARGVAGSDPVTQPGDCPGTRVTLALIACLQPDRRVEVEVTATP